MLLTKKIKLEVSERDAASLEFMQARCRALYNWRPSGGRRRVMRLRNGERWPGVYKAKKTLQESRAFDPEITQVYGKLLHEVFFRLDKAMQAFFRRIEAGEKPGFPRLRPRHCFFTLCYPAAYLKVTNKTLILPTGGGGKHGPKRLPNIVVTLTEAAPEHFKEVAISRDGRGNYYASFSYDENSAHNILARFLARPGPHTREECGVLHENKNSVEVLEASCYAQVQQLELFAQVNTF